MMRKWGALVEIRRHIISQCYSSLERLGLSANPYFIVSKGRRKHLNNSYIRSSSTISRCHFVKKKTTFENGFVAKSIFNLSSRNMSYETAQKDLAISLPHIVHSGYADTGAERSHMLNEAASLKPGTCVRLTGWVERHRLLGGLLFITLRDYTGSIQCAWSEAEAEMDQSELGLASQTAGLEGYSKATKLSQESVVSIYGYVRLRPEGMERTKTQGEGGRVEIRIQSMKLLNPAGPLPITFLSSPNTDTESVSSQLQSDEDSLLKYRFLELRLPEKQRIIRTRANISLSIRQELYRKGFIEIETPLLVKSTPEGAREFLVPTRSPGKFYALPQSPQQHKQLLMAAGFDKYFQIARCFRDEGGRQDRQPEFTQVDMEMSFVGQDEVISTLESLFLSVHESVFKHRLPATLLKHNNISHKFPRMRFIDAMNRYGSDKPDIRFGLEIVDVSHIFRSFANGTIVEDPLIQTCTDLDPTFLNEDQAITNRKTSGLRARDVRPCIKVLRISNLKLIKQTSTKEKTRSKSGVEQRRYKNQRELLEALQEEAKLGGSPSGALIIDTTKWKAPASMKLINNEEVQNSLYSEINAQLGETSGSSVLVFVAGSWVQTCNALGRVRSLIGKLCMDGIIEVDGQCGFTGDKEADSKSSFFRNKFLLEQELQSPLLGWNPYSADPPLPTFHWVIDFPLFEIEDEEGLQIHSSHHPFTAPHPDDKSKLLELSSTISKLRQQRKEGMKMKEYSESISSLLQLRALHYDFVSNGLEVGGGSIRLHSKEAQEAVFSLLNVDNEKFSHLLQALSLGCPPHGGFAAGLDRLTSICASLTHLPLRLRDVIAFPKTLTGKDLLLEAPALASSQQLDEYGIKVVTKTNE